MSLLRSYYIEIVRAINIRSLRDNGAPDSRPALDPHGAGCCEPEAWVPNQRPYSLIFVKRVL